MGDEATLVAHELGDVGQFAAGRGAEVENGFAGFRVEFAHGQKGAGVLDVKEALLKSAEFGERRMGFEFEDEIFFEPIAANEFVFDVFVAPFGEEFAGGRGSVECRVARGIVLSLNPKSHLTPAQ